MGGVARRRTIAARAGCLAMAAAQIVLEAGATSRYTGCSGSECGSGRTAAAGAGCALAVVGYPGVAIGYGIWRWFKMILNRWVISDL